MQDTLNFGFQLMQMVASLGLVLGLLALVLYGLRRWGHWVRKTGPDSMIRIEAQHPFGPKHHLLVVRVQEQSLLLGISPQGMHCLARLSETTAEPLNTEDKP